MNCPEEVIEKLMSILSFPDEFGMDPDESSIQDEDYYREVLNEYFPGTEIRYGVSKFVIILPNTDYVIKIPFNGIYEHCGYGDNYEETFFVNFHYAQSKYRKNDYCRAELDKYNNAKQLGLEKFFAEIHYYDDDVNGFAYYYQEKVIPSGAYHGKTASQKSYDKAFSYPVEETVCDVDWMARAIECYGEEAVTAFLNYVNKIDPEIGEDLHSMNYGYRPNGEPVLLDYSGWSEY